MKLKLAVAILAAGLIAVPVFAEESTVSVSEVLSEVELPTAVSGFTDETQDGITYAVTSSTRIENGNITICLDDIGTPPEGFTWTFLSDTEDDDENIIELITETDQDGHAYVGSFRAIKDGETSIRLIHTNGTYIDQYMDFDVTAEGGAITENTGGGCTYAPLAEDFAPVLDGKFIEVDGTATIEFTLTDDNGFDVVITDGTDKYTMTAYNDALYDVLLYTNGTSPENPEVSEVPDENGRTGETGAFIIDVEDEAFTQVNILWRNDAAEGAETRTFVKAAS